jgi:hypothetical protein
LGVAFWFVLWAAFWAAPIGTNLGFDLDRRVADPVALLEETANRQ